MHSTTAVVLFALVGLAIAKDAVVVLKTSDAVDVQALKDVEGATAVYKVKRLNFYNDPVYKGELKPGKFREVAWNYVVLGKDVKSKESFRKAVVSLPFVEKHSTLGLDKFPHFVVADLNKMMLKAPKKNFVKRPLAPAVSSYGCDDIVVDGSSDKDVLVMHLSKHACDTPKACEKTLKKYTGMLFYTVFPALGVTYEYSGRAEKGDTSFSAFTILKFGPKKTWCEYALSKFVRNTAPMIRESYRAMASLVAVQL